jgi:DNA-binding IclR family transcriptional regulator
LRQLPILELQTTGLSAGTALMGVFPDALRCGDARTSRPRQCSYNFPRPRSPKTSNPALEIGGMDSASQREGILMSEQQKPHQTATGGNQSLARGLTVLANLANIDGEMGIRDIARRMDLSTSIVHRLVKTMAELGFLEQNAETQRYRIGHKAFEVGYSYIKSHRLETVAPSELNRLAQEHQLNAFLGVLQGRSLVYLMTVQSSGPIAIRATVGGRVPLHTTAMSKAIMIDFPDEAILEMIGTGKMAKPASGTITDPAKFLKDIRQSRLRGFAVSNNELVEGVFSVAVPVRDISGNAVAAIAGSIPSHLHKPVDTMRIAKLVSQAAVNISLGLGAPKERLPLIQHN